MTHARATVPSQIVILSCCIFVIENGRQLLALQFLNFKLATTAKAASFSGTYFTVRKDRITVFQ
jgi:hypothetical protein